MNVAEAGDRKEFIAEAWETTRLEFFAQVVVIERIVASSPPRRRTLTALLSGNTEVLFSEWEGLITYWLMACNDDDDRVSSRAITSLRQMKNQTAIDAICRIAWQKSDSNAADASIAAEYVPSLPAERCLFLFSTCQWELLASDEDAAVHLANAYHSDEFTDEQRERFRQIAARHSRRELVEAMTRSYSANAISLLSEVERQTALRILLRTSDWKNLNAILLQNPAAVEVGIVCNHFVSNQEKIPADTWTIIHQHFDELSTETRKEVAELLVRYIEDEEPFTEWARISNIVNKSAGSISEEHWETLTEVGLRYPDRFFRFAADIPVIYGIKSLQAIKQLLGDEDCDLGQLMPEKDQLLTELMKMLPSEDPNEIAWSLRSEGRRETTTIKMPYLGDGTESGDIVKVLVSVGDPVAQGEDLFELETDKAVVTVPAEFGGKVTKILVAEGDNVAVGTALAYVRTPHPITLKRSDEIATEELRELLESLDRYEARDVRALAECVLAFVTWARTATQGSEVQQSQNGAYILLPYGADHFANEEPSETQ